MKKSTVIVTIIAVVVIIAGVFGFGYWLGKPSTPPQITDATKVKLELALGDWGAIFGAVERNASKLAKLDTSKPQGPKAIDSIGMALNTVRKALTDQNPILKPRQ